MRNLRLALLTIFLVGVTVVFEAAAQGTTVVIPFRIVLIEQASEGLLKVREIAAFSTAGVPAEAGRAVHLSLPQGARKIAPVRGLTPVAMTQEGVVAYILPADPRLQETVLSYEVPYRWRRIALSYPVGLPTGSFDIFVPEGIRVESQELTRMPARKVRGRLIQRLAAEGLDPHQTVVVSLSGLPLPYKDLGIQGGILLMAVAVVVALVAPWIRRPGSCGGGLPN